jgi:hypothetical protein
VLDWRTEKKTKFNAAGNPHKLEQGFYPGGGGLEYYTYTYILFQPQFEILHRVLNYKEAKRLHL